MSWLGTNSILVLLLAISVIFNQVESGLPEEDMTVPEIIAYHGYPVGELHLLYKLFCV